MNKWTIRQLFFSLIIFGSTIAVVFLSLNYTYMKKTVEKSLDLESINKAYHASKRLTQINDMIAREYAKSEEDMYKSLQEAQRYFKKFGRKAPLDILKKRLENNKKGIYYNIFIINSNFVIENTTFAPDMNLDFRIIPDAFKIVKKTYLNPEYIDLSSVKDDATSHDYKRYILQHSKSGDYLIQLGLSLEITNSINNVTANMSKEIPSLLSSEIFSIYHDEDMDDSIYQVWSEKYTNMTKQDRLRSRDVYKYFMSKFDHEDKIDKKDYKKKIFEFANHNEYKDIYIYKNNKYIHRVMMPFYSYINADEGTVHVLVLEFDETQAKEIVKNMNMISTTLWVLFIVIGLLMIVLINNRIIKPISILQSKMKKKDPVDRDIILKNSDEISSMMSIYNQLLIDLKREITSNEELLEEFKIFTGNAIHQVRTPISVIKIALEMIETESKDAILQIESSLISIEHMYDSLAYSLQEESVDFIAEELDLSKLLQERIALFSTVAQAHDTQISSQVQSGIYVKMNETEAEYLIDNNISNAIKYGMRDKPIEVNLYSTETDVILSIDSAGEPIEDTNVIFERYYIKDKSRRGSGIGLNMVKNICKKNSIFISVKHIDGYNRFSYYLPSMSQ